MTALEKIHSLDKFGSRPGLERIKRFLDILGNPQDDLKFVHVAGTNGKGSVCALVSSVLTEAGYKTGLFISPFIVNFRERIQINGEMISPEILENAVERTFPIIERLRDDDCIITEFEYVMALEFLIHSEAECDVVVLETGLGGLLDCTNVIKPPLCAVITKIGLDHTDILGSSIEEIAAQKCGIIKSGSAVVTSAQDARAMKVIEADCASKGVELTKSENIGLRVLGDTLGGMRLEYKNTELSLRLVGEHQLENASTALAALEIVEKFLPHTLADIQNGFKNTVNPARFEPLSDEPIVILDGAHNPDGINALKNAVKKYLPDKRIIAVMGMLADKDSKSSIEILSGMFAEVYTVPINNPRALSPVKLAEECEPYFDRVRAFDSPFDAFDEALKNAKIDGSAVIIAGSLYLAGEIRPYIISRI